MACIFFQIHSTKVQINIEENKTFLCFRFKVINDITTLHEQIKPTNLTIFSSISHQAVTGITVDPICTGSTVSACVIYTIVYVCRAKQSGNKFNFSFRSSNGSQNVNMRNNFVTRSESYLYSFFRPLWNQVDKSHKRWRNYFHDRVHLGNMNHCYSGWWRHHNVGLCNQRCKYSCSCSFGQDKSLFERIEKYLGHL